MLILVFIIGLLVGFLGGMFYCRGQTKTLMEEVIQLKTELTKAHVRLDAELEKGAEKFKLLEQAEAKLANSFKALSLDALKSNNESFLDLAKTTLERYQESAKGDLGKRQEAIDNMVVPIQKALARFDDKVNELERNRQSAYVGLSEQIKNLVTTQHKLESETMNLVKALRTPHVKGQWGEIHLKRTVELAGMINRVDFLEQESTETEDGIQRPDMVISLPNSRKIVVDAKAPLNAYLDAIEASNEIEQKRKQKSHARQIKDHLIKLGAKSYWKQFEPTPEFVVLFLPGEAFFSTALQHDPTLIDFGIENRVILATPTTLIALLKAVAYGWRHESITEEAKTICELGNTLYHRISILSGHFGDMKKGLERTVTSYNKMMSSLETRILPSARKFKDLKVASGKSIEAFQPVETPIAVPTQEELSVID